MTKTPRVHYWKDKPLTDLSREELIEAVEYCAGRIAGLTTSESIDARAIGRVEMLKRVTAARRSWLQRLLAS